MQTAATSSRSSMAAIELALLGLLFLGGIVWLSLPSMRGTSASFGWMPLWLFVMPGVALLTAIGLRIAHRHHDAATTPSRRRRPTTPERRPQRPQARRHRLARAA